MSSDETLSAILAELRILNKNMKDVLCLQKLQAMKYAAKQKQLDDDSGLGRTPGIALEVQGGISNVQAP